MHDIYFSGDLTSAPQPDGASELFHVGGQARGAWLVNLNYYNYYREDNKSCDFKIVVGQEQKDNIVKNYLVDPNKLIAASNSNLDEKGRILGIVVADDKSSRFYFTETSSCSQLRSANNGEHAKPS